MLRQQLTQDGAVVGTPFVSRSRETLRQKVVTGTMDPVPAGARVPKWLQAIVLRGLSLSPAARYPSMEALLDALSRDPRSTMRRGLAVGLVLMLVGAGFGLSSLLQARLLDRYASDWEGMSRESCEATEVQGRQPVRVLILRDECLARRLAELRALTRLLVGRVDRGVLDRCVAKRR